MADYLLRRVADIRQGQAQSSRGPIKAGWAMGAFYENTELPFTEDFEVKEWDSSLINRHWSDHALDGSEYISVTSGVLTIVAGRKLADVEYPIESERIEVRAGFSAVLRPGFWRRFECTPDAAGMTVRRGSTRPRQT